jgi:hypothetical protein
VPQLWSATGEETTWPRTDLVGALFAPLFDGPARGNIARFTFLDPSSGDFYPDWEQGAHAIVAALRGEAGRNPYDKALTDFIGELSTRSDVFRTLWAAHDVRLHRTGTKRIHHALVGDLDLAYEALALTPDDGLVLNAFTAEPGSASAAMDRRMRAGARAVRRPRPMRRHDPGCQKRGTWEGAANITVALLRAEAGRHPHDTQLRELVGELSTVSEEFRTRWAAHNVRIHHAGTKQFRHPAVGTLDLVSHTLDLPTEDHGVLGLTIYTAEPGSSSEDGLKLLASWAATTTDASAPATDRPCWAAGVALQEKRPGSICWPRAA